MWTKPYLIHLNITPSIVTSFCSGTDNVLQGRLASFIKPRPSESYSLNTWCENNQRKLNNNFLVLELNELAPLSLSKNTLIDKWIGT